MPSGSDRLDDSPYRLGKRRLSLEGSKMGPENKDSQVEDRFILVVQYVFSRKIWAEAMPTKLPAEVLRAFKRLLCVN